jgi:hypothetical protein
MRVSAEVCVCACAVSQPGPLDRGCTVPGSDGQRGSRRRRRSLLLAQRPEAVASGRLPLRRRSSAAHGAHPVLRLRQLHAAREPLPQRLFSVDGLRHGRHQHWHRNTTFPAGTAASPANVRPYYTLWRAFANQQCPSPCVMANAGSDMYYWMETLDEISSIAIKNMVEAIAMYRQTASTRPWPFPYAVE